MKPDSPGTSSAPSVPGEDRPSLGLFFSLLSHKRPDHIFAAFCSAANVATQKQQNITTVDLPGIRLKHTLLWVLILCAIPITYPFTALRCQHFIIFLKQASILLP